MDKLGKMLRRGVALKSLYLRLPCRFTAWLLIRQVARIERILPPEPSHVVETFGRLRFEEKHPVARVHEARLVREAKVAESRLVVAELEDVFRSMREWGR